MARLISDGEAGLGAGADGDAFYRLGMMYAAGRSVPVDLVAAHKWLNLAAARGSAEAVRLRRELAAEMNREDILEAQRQARQWVGVH